MTASLRLMKPVALGSGIENEEQPKFGRLIMLAATHLSLVEMQIEMISCRGNAVPFQQFPDFVQIKFKFQVCAHVFVLNPVVLLHARGLHCIYYK